MKYSQKRQHTQGPWVARRPLDSNHYNIWATDTATLVGTVCDNPKLTVDYINANAALISHAPDMLEALEIAETALADAFNLAVVHSVPTSKLFYNAAFNKVITAIKKAKGDV